jgi:hypothetical protein
MSGNNSDKNNNQEINDKHRNMTIKSDTNSSRLTHDHEAFIHQIRLFSGLTSQELKSIDKGKEVWFEEGDKKNCGGGTRYFLCTIRREGRSNTERWIQRSSAFHL